MKKLLLEQYESEITIIYSLEKKPPVTGALITALSKSIKREFVVNYIKNDMADMDVTTTAAMQIIKRVMGRGVSNKYLLEVFGTADRTASNKSDIFTMDLDEYEDRIKKDLAVFKEDMKLILKSTQLKIRG
jgi:hypothetical protein